jgi:hypothetical protein
MEGWSGCGWEVAPNRRYGTSRLEFKDAVRPETPPDAPSLRRDSLGLAPACIWWRPH